MSMCWDPLHADPFTPPSNFADQIVDLPHLFLILAGMLLLSLATFGIDSCIGSFMHASGKTTSTRTPTVGLCAQGE